MKKTLIVAILLAGFFTASAQVTTSSVNGVVTQAAGKKTAGATIKAVHQPSGTVYSGVSNSSGYFNLPNLRVGGPYTIEITYANLRPVIYNDVYLQLGEPFAADATLTQESETSIEAVKIVAVGRNSKKNGATTVVGRKQLESMPTLSRSLQDFTRLTPQANGNSFGGANNRYNNITIDGAVNNDVFGLSGSGTPGGTSWYSTNLIGRYSRTSGSSCTF